MLIPVEKAKELLLKYLGEPDDINRLDEYVQFIYENEYKSIDECYCEEHHILPRCIKDTEYTVRLKYNDHCEAHLLLFLTYNRNDLQKTLNFMKPTLDERTSDYKDALSLARKRGWDKFKESDRYEDYLAQSSVRTSERMKNGFAKELSNKRYSKPGAREKIGKQFKELWADDEYKERVRQSMIEERNTTEGKARMKKASQDSWDNKSDEDRVEFIETMTRVNGDINKRKDAGEKIKSKWEDPKFRDKMLNRKRSEEKNKEHGSTMKDKWKDPVFKAMMLRKRKEAKERKLKNEAK